MSKLIYLGAKLVHFFMSY